MRRVVVLVVVTMSVEDVVVVVVAAAAVFVFTALCRPWNVVIVFIREWERMNS